MMDSPARPAPLTTDTSGRCALHPNTTARLTCARCGDYACEPCLQAGQGRCVGCARRPPVVSSPYHAVSVGRFVLFTALTAGWYPYYWSYRTWSGIRGRDRSAIWPLVRSVFIALSTFGLVRDLNAHGSRDAPQGALLWYCASAYFVTNVLVPNELPWSTLGLLRALLFIPLLRCMRRRTSPHSLRELDRWRPRHALVLAFGAPLWWFHFVGREAMERLAGVPGT